MGIYIAAAITFVSAALIWGPVILAKQSKGEKKFLLILIALTLPMSLLLYDFVRMPLQKLTAELFRNSRLPVILATLWAPLTEEPGKLWPLLLPFVRQRLHSDNLVRSALALGLGFGMGEVVMLAIKISASKQPALAWYMYGGFLGERIVVCFIHGGLTAIALKQWGQRTFIWGILGAMVLHFLLNIPIFIFGMNQNFGLEKAVVQVILSFYIVFFFLAMLGITAYLQFGTANAGQLLFDYATCPKCGKQFHRSIWALNLGWHRYERCPHCKKWSLIRLKQS